jgi:hypothetical protein
VYFETSGGPSGAKAAMASKPRFGREDARWNADRQAVEFGVEIV